MQVNLYQSSQADPMLNLALEEYLFDNIDPEQSLLLLYTNRPSVVIGSFQNPWLEANLDWLSNKEYPLVRRISGGGTVWHDFGNLNLSWLGPRKHFDRVRLLRLVQTALSDCGVEVEITERGDLLQSGKKLSGNALCYRSDRVLHHMTLLIDADLANLRLSLRPDYHGWQFSRSLGVRSQPASVSRIVDLIKDSDPIAFRNKLISALETLLGVRIQDIHLPKNSPTFTVLQEKYHSWEWNFGRTPDFTAQSLDPVTWKITEIEVSHGRLTQSETNAAGNLGATKLLSFPGCKELRII